MKRSHLAGLALVAVAAACSDSPAGPSANELQLAQESQVIAQNLSTSWGAPWGVHHLGWLRRLLDTLRTTDDPEAQAFLAQARAYRDSAWMAIQAGDRVAAREFFHKSFIAILSAVVEIFPNAPARTGGAVDAIVARIEGHLGDREAPRIRRVLAYVEGLRDRADNALANGQPVQALLLNLRSLDILHRLVYHLRDGMDHEREADREMEDGASRGL